MSSHRPVASTLHDRPRAAFTLVELLVVIGIIAVLISILLPTLGKARASARSVQCQSNLRQFFMADQNYMNRYRGWHMPGWVGGGATNGNLAGAQGWDIWTSLEELRRTIQIVWKPNKGPEAVGWRGYLPNNRLCPEMVRGWADVHKADAASGWVDLYVNYSYGMNVDGVDFNPTNLNDVVYNPTRYSQCLITLPWNSAVHGFKNSQVKQSAEKIFLVDAMYWWVNRYGSGVQPGWKGRISNYDLTGERTHTGTVAAGAYNSERTVAWRHKGYANVVFFDGHGEQVRKDRFTMRDASGKLIPNMKMWDVSQ